MLNKELNKYKEMYSSLVTAFAKLHNAHLSFLINKGVETGFAVRKELRQMEELSKGLKKQSQLVNKEIVQNRKLEKIQKREEKLNKKKKRNNDMAVPKSNS